MKKEIFACLEQVKTMFKKHKNCKPDKVEKPNEVENLNENKSNKLDKVDKPDTEENMTEYNVHEETGNNEKEEKKDDNTLLDSIQDYTNGSIIENYFKTNLFQSRSGISFVDSNVHNKKVNELNEEINRLKCHIHAIENKSWGEYIDKYVDKWFDTNKSEVDIGVVNVGGLFTIDLLPDTVEKYIYKKVIKIVFSLVTDLKI